MRAEDEAALTFSGAPCAENISLLEHVGEGGREEGRDGGMTRRQRKAEKIEISRDFPSCFSSPRRRGLDRREPNRSSFDTVRTLFYFGDKTLTPPTSYTTHTRTVVIHPLGLDVLCEMLLGLLIHWRPSIVLHRSAQFDL